MKQRIREPAVAGKFYPADAVELREMILDFLGRVVSCGSSQPKALIVPHAGYVYSGPIAASAYARVRPDEISRVVLLGPAHRVFISGLAVPESRAWNTPLGEIPIDEDALSEIGMLSQVQFSDVAHRLEHSLEVQLPFLQTVLNEFTLVPLVVGDAAPEEVAEVLNVLWGGPETLLVISSDLSHYKSYDRAQEKDRATARAIVELNARGVDPDSACGCRPIAGLLHLAQQKGLRAELFDLRNSGDTAGPRDAVVGYGAFGFYE